MHVAQDVIQGQKKKKKVGCAENGGRVDEMKAGFLQVSLSPKFSAYWPYISLCKQGRISLYENYFKITGSNL